MPLFRITERFCSEETSLFSSKGQSLKKNICTSFPMALCSRGERSAKKLSRRGLQTSGYTVQPVTVSPQRQTSSETFAFFISPGELFCNCTCTCTCPGCNLRRPPRTGMSSGRRGQLASTVSDVLHVEFSLWGDGEVRHLNTCMQCHLCDKDECREAIVS